MKVSVISTGSVQIRPEHVGPTRQPTYLWLMVTARSWTPPRPINAYVIEHPEGVVLFDTGQDIASVTDSAYFPGGPVGLLYDRLAKFSITPEQTLAASLRQLGHEPADVHTAILSHLHQDHIGGLRDLTRSRILVSATEWEDMRKPFGELRGFLRTHIDLPGLTWEQVAYEPLGDADLAPFTTGHDLFGDGTLIVLPTPGHTAGSQSLLVRRPGRAPLLMVGDLTYDANLLAAGEIPGVGDRKTMRHAVSMVNELRRRHPDLVVLPAHDPGAADRLAAA
ncbi:N-acyl homoserine lactonase family protein [Hamadaea sp.]|uniref:N-acyl homoserine lactonase family protein n=1 Tax=Hamadaea sp. TaxID=2024425 RepID=UPI0025C6306C|nr:N-acyl homoserine lactonase family protein [Hamadaea sp.]